MTDSDKIFHDLSIAYLMCRPTSEHPDTPAEFFDEYLKLFNEFKNLEAESSIEWLY